LEVRNKYFQIKSLFGATYLVRAVKISQATSDCQQYQFCRTATTVSRIGGQFGEQIFCSKIGKHETVSNALITKKAELA
jgi:hypothetical protein